MERYIFEVVKEYEFSFDELYEPIKGKVLMQISGSCNPETKYSWKLSHYPVFKGGGVYIPGRQAESSFEGAEYSMLSYVQAIKTQEFMRDETY